MNDLKMQKKDLQVRYKIKNMLDRCNRLPYKYQSKIRFDPECYS